MSQKDMRPLDTPRIRALVEPFDKMGLWTLVYLPKDRLVEFSARTASQNGVPALWHDVPECFDGITDPADYGALCAMYHSVAAGADGATATLRSANLDACYKVTLRAVEKDAKHRTTLAIAIIEDANDRLKSDRLTEQVASLIGGTDADHVELAQVRNRVAEAIGGAYYAIYHADVATHEFVCLREEMPGVTNSVGIHGIYEDAWAKNIAEFVDPEDRAPLHAFDRLEDLADSLRDQDSHAHEYRRIGMGWVQGEFLACARDALGNPTSIAYVIRNIDGEHRRAERAEASLYAATHDPLAGTLNRRAFDEAMEAGLGRASNVGLLILDIDNFKDLNDEHGHEFGDLVIERVGSSLVSVFREGDSVFRLGGDEFAVLLRDCDASCWNSLRRKLGVLHAELSEGLEEDVYITLSTGACFGSNGLEEWMYEAADQGLYQTKRNGRAGCTLVDEEGHAQASWRDDSMSRLSLAAYAGSNSGTARLEYPIDPDKRPRFVIGDALRTMFSIPKDATPEQCFALWDAGIDEDDREVLIKAGEAMIERTNVETSYLWHDPTGDSFRVRIVGSGRHEDGVDAFYSIHRSMRGNLLIEREDDTKLILAAQSSVSTSTIYFDLAEDRMTLTRMPGLPKGQTIELQNAATELACHADEIASPTDLARLLEFIDVATLDERIGKAGFIDLEIETVTRYGWCCCRWIPVRRNRSGKLTHALFTLTTIDAAKQAQLERDREVAQLMQIHYDAAESLSSSRIFGVALVDRETGESQSWDITEDGLVKMDLTYEELLDRACEVVVEPAAGEYRASLGLSHVLAQVEEHGSYTTRAHMHHLDQDWYLEYTFKPYPHDPRYVLEAIQDLTAIHAEEGRTVEDLFDNVPGGLVTYEWDGRSLNILHISRYYDELYGTSIAHEGDDGEKGPDFQRVHPDDIDDYRRAIAFALAETHEIHYEFRVWSEPQGRWTWCKVDAVSREMDNGHQLVYAMYSDITAQKDAQAKLAGTSRIVAERADALFAADPMMLCVSNFNLTQDRIYDMRLDEPDFEPFSKTTSYSMATDAMTAALSQTDAERYREAFGREALLAAFDRGEREVRMEALFKLAPHRTEWLESAVELTWNDETGEVEGVSYARNLSYKRMGELMLDQGFKADYPMVAVLVGNGEEYYLYDRSRDAFCERRVGFWEAYERSISRVVGEDEARRVCAGIDRDEVFARLAAGDAPEFAFDVTGQEDARYVLRFSNLDAEKGLVLAAVRNVVDKALYDRLRYEGDHDELTGLLNRAGFFKGVRRTLDGHPGETFSLARLDVQSFRLFNSFFGEEAGDELLRAIADGVRDYCGAYGDRAVCGRLNSDVFVMLVPAGQEVLDRGIQIISRDFSSYRDDFLFEPALGIYRITDPTLSVEAMVARATTAAAQARKAGSGYVAYYDEGMERRQNVEMLVQKDMRRALESGQFKVYVQPKFDFATGRPCGGEALVRWDHPERGLVSPGVFIPVFETNGFVAELDRHMWESVCVLLRSWIDRGLAAWPVSVNVSRVSAYDPRSVPFLKDLVARYDLDPSLLELELTESAYIDDPDRVKRQLEDLQAFGFKIVMDDFGTGYSSLNTLRDLPVDVIKLDRGFLTQACADERGRTVLSSMVDLAHKLGLPIVVEGVEDEAQADYLRSLGCEYVQGFLYARPMPATEYEALLG